MFTLNLVLSLSSSSSIVLYLGALKRSECFAFHFDLDLAVLGCKVSPESMQVVRKVIDDILPRLNLSRYPPVENLSPVDIKSFLMRNSLRFCVLVVDAATLQNAYQCLEELIRIAADKVGKNITYVLRFIY